MLAYNVRSNWNPLISCWVPLARGVTYGGGFRVKIEALDFGVLHRYKSCPSLACAQIVRRYSLIASHYKPTSQFIPQRTIKRYLAIY